MPHDNPSQGVTTLTVIRSADAKKHQFNVPLSISLKEFKGKIQASPLLNDREDNTQPFRLFWLGRELKTGNRSLTALGLGGPLGKVNILHVFVPSRSIKSTNGVKRKRDDTSRSQPQQEVIELLDDDDDDEGNSSVQKHQRQRQDSTSSVQIVGSKSGRDNDVTVVDSDDPEWGV